MSINHFKSVLGEFLADANEPFAGMSLENDWTFFHDLLKVSTLGLEDLAAYTAPFNQVIREWWTTAAARELITTSDIQSSLTNSLTIATLHLHLLLWHLDPREELVTL